MLTGKSKFKFIACFHKNIYTVTSNNSKQLSTPQVKNGNAWKFVTFHNHFNKKARVSVQNQKPYFLSLIKTSSKRKTPKTKV